MFYSRVGTFCSRGVHPFPRCTHEIHPTAGCPCRAVDSAAGSGPIRFAKYQIESAFRTEGVTVFDVQNTGVLNIDTRQYWYEWPPSVSTRHEISEPRTWNPLTDEW